MKKILAGLGLTVLLCGCSFGSGPAEPIVDEPGEDPGALMPIALTDDLFITLSAQILCLPANNPEASRDEIEMLARQVLADANVDENDFGIYQRTVEADPPSKKELSLAIVGKMSEFCTIETNVDQSSGEAAQDTATDEPEADSETPTE